MAFDLDAAREAFRKGLPSGDRKSTQSWGWDEWTRDWYVDGELAVDVLGPEGASWWFRVLTDPRRLHGEVPEVGAEPLTEKAARLRLERFVTAADEHLGAWPKHALSPIAFPLREATDARTAARIWVESIGSNQKELVDGLGPLSDEEAAEVASLLTEPAAILAIGTNWPFLLERLTALKAWDEAHLAAYELPIAERAAWLVEHRGAVRPVDLVEAADALGDDAFEALAKRALRHRDREVWDAAALRPTPGLVDLVLGRVEDPIAPWAFQWFEGAGDDVLERVVERAQGRSKLNGPARKVLRRFERRRVAALLAEGDALADLFGGARPSRGELPRNQRSAWMTQVSQRTPQPEAWLELEALPPLETADGYRLPTDVRDGIIATLGEVRFGIDRDGAFADRYDASLDMLREALDADSADDFWSALFAQWWTAGHPASSRWVVRAAAFLCSARGIRDLGTRLGRHRTWFGTVGGDVIDALGRNGSGWAVVALVDQTHRARSAELRKRAQKTLDFAAQRAGMTTDGYVESSLPDVLHPVLLRVIGQRLERAMRGQSPWSGYRWKRLLQNPSFGEVAKAVLWSVADPFGSGAALVRWDGESVVGPDDGTVELDDDVDVLVCHPAAVPDRDLKRWTSIFVDYEIVQPFEQLSRTRYRSNSLSQDGFRHPTSSNFDGREIVRRADPLGWEPLTEGAHGDVIGLRRCWPHLDLCAILRLSEPIEADTSGPTGLARVEFRTTAGDLLEAPDVVPAVFSEVHADVMVLFV